MYTTYTSQELLTILKPVYSLTITSVLQRVTLILSFLTRKKLLPPEGQHKEKGIIIPALLGMTLFSCCPQ
jgi:hypothetical protein